MGKIFHNWHTKEHGDRRVLERGPSSCTTPNHGDDTPRSAASCRRILEVYRRRARKYGNTCRLCECRDVPDEAYYDGRVAAEAVKVMREVEGGPFFLGRRFLETARPFNAPKKYGHV